MYFVCPIAAIPPLPAASTGTVSTEREPVLLWIRRGRAWIRVGEYERILETRGALWVPAGVPWSLRTAPGTLAVPIMVPGVEIPAELNRVLELSVPVEWSDWMLAQFAHNLGFLRGSHGSAAGVLPLLTAAARANPLSTHPEFPPPLSPPMPHSTAAYSVARILVETPADDRALAEFARLNRVSLRTLQRQFSVETGLSFMRWRTLTRIAHATDLLATGHDIGWTGRQVGFVTPAGFTRAFREHTGMNPRDFKQLGASSPAARPISAPALGAAPPAPKLAAVESWARVNDFHVLVWAYLGTIRVTHGGRVTELSEGDVMWLPAGVRNRVEVAADSVLLPLGSRPGTAPEPAAPDRILRVPPGGEAYFLFHTVANYSRIRPAMHDDALMTNMALAARDAPRPASPLPRRDPVHHILGAVHANPALDYSLAHWGRILGMRPEDLNERFVRVTGQSYPLWRAQLRMTLARNQLRQGRSAGEIGRTLGYSHPSGFTKVFFSAHGMSPRQFQRHGWSGTNETLIDP